MRAGVRKLMATYNPSLIWLSGKRHHPLTSQLVGRIRQVSISYFPCFASQLASLLACVRACLSTRFVPACCPDCQVCQLMAARNAAH